MTNEFSVVERALRVSALPTSTGGLIAGLILISGLTWLVFVAGLTEPNRTWMSIGSGMITILILFGPSSLKPGGRGSGVSVTRRTVLLHYCVFIGLSGLALIATAGFSQLVITLTIGIVQVIYCVGLALNFRRLRQQRSL